MKKVLITLVAALSAITLCAEANVGFWMDAPKATAPRASKVSLSDCPSQKSKTAKALRFPFSAASQLMMLKASRVLLV